MSSPAVLPAVVYFGCSDGHLYAVDLEGGEELWRFATGNQIFSSPKVSNGVIYFGSNDHHLYALNEPVHTNVRSAQ